ncbi:MAG TPA: OmpA family protein [Chitinophagaceae bacterium]|nr:OmpA family protein [Chitinophagaceae bacterium]
MKRIFWCALLTAITVEAHAQSTGDILKREAGQGVREGTNVATQKAADKLLGKFFNKKNKNNTPAGGPDSSGAGTSKSSGTSVSASGSTANQGPGTAEPTLKTYSKYDFVAGDKVLVWEDFAQDAVGDFPDKWNTNGSGEIVTASGQTGHWLMINKKGRFIPEFITSLPDNFTFECDVVSNEKFSFYSNPLQIFFLTGGNGKEVMEYSFIQIDKRSGVKLGIHPTNAGSNGGIASIQTFEDGATVINNELATTQFNSNAGKTRVKLSVWRQKQRIRVYLNEEKVFDLPRAFAADRTYNTVLFELWSGMNNDQDRYLISNIKLAVGAPDTRNKLINEGRFSTTGILFDVNAAVIKPESYGTLKDIADVLTENGSVRVRIVGHTDSDGNADMNLTLSKKRAEAVKQALADNFAIDPSRLETDGKGSTQPAAPNTSPEGKAQNRRVEFIKL